MSELRWILLAVGVLLLIGIYWYSRRSPQTPVDAPVRREPSLPAHGETDIGATRPTVPAATTSDETAVAATSQTVAPDEEPLYAQSALPLAEVDEAKASASGQQTSKQEKIIAIHVAARGGRRFRGPDLVDALKAEALDFGDLGIFHRRTGNRAVFSVSSMVEPGHFDLEDVESYTTPGVTFFMIMPGPESPVATFTEMLSTARRLATVLDGDVLDESGSTLSRQAASHMREQIIEFAHRVR